MKKLILVVLATISLIFSGCGRTTLGNGKIDPVEEATLRVSIGAAMTAYPLAVEPAYLVSSALLIAMGEQPVAAMTDLIDKVIADEAAKLKLDKPTLASFNELVALIKADIQELLRVEKIETSNTYIVVKDLIKIINVTAAARR